MKSNFIVIFHIHGSQKMYSYGFDDPLSFHLAPSSSQTVNMSITLVHNQIPADSDLVYAFFTHFLVLKKEEKVIDSETFRVCLPDNFKQLAI